MGCFAPGDTLLDDLCDSFSDNTFLGHGLTRAEAYTSAYEQATAVFDLSQVSPSADWLTVQNSIFRPEVAAQRSQPQPQGLYFILIYVRALQEYAGSGASGRGAERGGGRGAQQRTAHKAWLKAWREQELNSILQPLDLSL
jgi:hypothetical protein